MANGYGNIVGRGSALNLAPLQQMRPLPARKRPPRVRVRAGRGVPDPGSRAGGGRNPGRSNAEVMAELQEVGIRGAQELQEREQARQAAIETERMRQEDLTTLAQQVRGESPAQLEARKRQMEMEGLRDVEKRRNRQRAAFETAGVLRQGIVGGAFKNEAKEGQPAMYRLPDTMQGALASLMSGFNPQLDDKGKVKPVYARLGTTQEGNPAYEFFHADAPIMNNGVPAKLPVKVMNAQADIWDFQMREQAGFGPTRRKARQEEADITEARAKAERDRAEAQYALAGKPKTASSTAMTSKERQKALLDTQRLYSDLLEMEPQLLVGRVDRTLPQEHIDLKEQVKQRMDALRLAEPPSVDRGARRAPPEAIAFLRQNDTPQMRQAFIEQYGALPEGF